MRAHLVFRDHAILVRIRIGEHLVDAFVDLVAAELAILVLVHHPEHRGHMLRLAVVAVMALATFLRCLPMCIMAVMRVRLRRGQRRAARKKASRQECDAGTRFHHEDPRWVDSMTAIVADPPGPIVTIYLLLQV